jgi:hypothetical protein
MLKPNIVALLNDASDHLRNHRAAKAHALVAIAERIAAKDRTVSPARRDAIRAARLLCASAI